MELAEPSIQDAFNSCVSQGANIVSPLFLLPGRHWNQDIPSLTAAAAKEHPGVSYMVTAPLGLHPLLLVRMLGTKRFKDTIFITLPSNGQSVEIDVNGDPGETAASETTTISYTLWPTIHGGLAILILIVVVFKYYSDKPDRSHIPVAPATPSMAAPITPERGSPAVVSDLSPRTPQPFMDYVRRTIDETPYYRREPRRRVNPQNTF